MLATGSFEKEGVVAQTRTKAEEAKDTRPHILLIDDEASIRHAFGMQLECDGFVVETAENGERGFALLKERLYDVVLCDVRMPVLDGPGFLRALQEGGSAHPPVVMMSAFADFDQALEAIQHGAEDFIQKPFRHEEFLFRVRRAIERNRLVAAGDTLRALVSFRSGAEEEAEGEGTVFAGIIGRSRPMLDLFRLLRRVAAHKATALILGESGTGKELVARALHYESPRRDGQFVAVNCGAITETLLESELFGHVRGAFTDAIRDKTGFFEQANGGTIFLDEIGELPKSLQVKLLRVLQENEVVRVGESRPRPIDVRVIAASNRNLDEEVRSGRFREDLFFRLNVVQLKLSPLRERTEDVPLLVEHFLERVRERHGIAVSGIDPDVIQLFREYAWPGNVRELENTIERCALLCGGTITTADLPGEIREVRNPVRVALASGDLSIKRGQRAMEEELIRAALRKTGGNRTRAARLLEISHRALLYKIKAYGVTEPY